jgi:PKD repeat protein
VTLDASASSGDVKTFAWTSPAPIGLSDPTSAKPTFKAPAPGSYTFSLTVTGPGGPSTATVTVAVQAAVNAVANAGPNQVNARRGTKVTLDGTRSIGAATYAWTQVARAGDPTVALAGANTAQPTFTFPLYNYPANNGLLAFNLHVTSPDGSSADAQVTITPAADSMAITTARYTASKREWRVDGTSSVLAGQRVTVHLGGLDGPALGTATVDAAGAFSVRVTSATAGRTGQTVSAESQLGGTVAGVAVRVQ